MAKIIKYNNRIYKITSTTKGAIPLANAAYYNETTSRWRKVENLDRRKMLAKKYKA